MNMRNSATEWSRLWGICGVIGGVLGVLGHFLLPAGFPQDGDAAHQLAWVIDNATAIRFAATLGVIGGLLMLIFGRVTVRYLRDVGHRGILASVSAESVGAAGAIVALGYLMLSVATWAGTAPETETLIYVPELVNIGVLFAVFGWVLALPAIAACAGVVRTNRVIGVASILGVLAVGLTLLIPALAWVPGALWFVTVGTAIAFSHRDPESGRRPMGAGAVPAG